MMKEIQKSNDLQERWKLMIYKVCLPLSMRCHLEELCVNTKELWDDVVEAFEPLVFGFKEFFEALSKVTEDTKNITRPQLNIRNPQYPQISVDNFRVNTKGFQTPPRRCARSRCK